MKSEESKEPTKVIAADQAIVKSENSQGALTMFYEKITRKILFECEKGNREAWVEIPTNNLEEEIKDELRLAGYILKNREGCNVLITW